jgi:hypothetical protein
VDSHERQVESSHERQVALTLLQVPGQSHHQALTSAQTAALTPKRLNLILLKLLIRPQFLPIVH